MRAKLEEIKQELQVRMNKPIAQTGQWLKVGGAGILQLHAVPDNTDSLCVFSFRVKRLYGGRC